LRSSGELFIQDDSRIFNFSIASMGGITWPWLYYHLAAQKQQGVKLRRAVILPAATVVSKQKNAKIYIV
jgi:hypothetical protein